MVVTQSTSTPALQKFLLDARYIVWSQIHQSFARVPFVRLSEEHEELPAVDSDGFHEERHGLGKRAFQFAEVDKDERKAYRSTRGSNQRPQQSNMYCCVKHISCGSVSARATVDFYYS